MSHAERRCVGLFGLFDVDDFDVQVRVRVAMHELGRRRPDLVLRLFAPFGSTRPLPVAADLAVEPLAQPAGALSAQALHDQLGAVIRIGASEDGNEVYDGIEPLYAGHPEVDPRDVLTALQLMRRDALALPAGNDPTEPNPALLGRRVWSYGVCEQRREFLRAMHWWPQRGAPVVVVGCDDDTERIDALASRLRLGDRDVIVVGAGLGDDEFSTECAASIRRARHMAADRSSIEDRVAAIAGAATVVTSNATALALADAYGRPRRALDAFADAPGTRAARRAPSTIARDEASLDTAYDGLATLVPGDIVSVLEHNEIAALRAALDAQARRVAHERVVLADYVRAVRNNAAQETAELRAAITEQPLRRLRNALRRRGD